jgi:hypothetical protein
VIGRLGEVGSRLARALGTRTKRAGNLVVAPVPRQIRNSMTLPFKIYPCRKTARKC